MNFNQLRKTSERVFRNTPSSGPGSTIAKVLAGIAITGVVAANSLWTVESGHRGVIFNKMTGVQPQTYIEGTHVRIPFLEVPTIFDVRSRPSQSRSLTGTRDLQMVDVALRVLYKPDANKLPHILQRLGVDYDERVLPSIVNETLKAIIAQFNASQLITQRESVSQMIKRDLTERAANFDILVDDVSITHLSFGKEYSAAIENKQIAQAQAERAKYIVQKALQDKKSTIIHAQGEAKAAELIGQALAANPGYIELRRLEAAKNIASAVAESNNKLYLDANNLMLGVQSEDAARVAH